MSVSVDQFWQLIDQSKLLDGDVREELADQWQHMKGATRTTSARTLSEWLVAEGYVTRFQAKLLLTGQPGPFHFGDYLLSKRLRRGALRNRYQAVHVPTHTPVTLRFVDKANLPNQLKAHHARDWLMPRRRPADHGGPCYEYVDLGAYQFAVFDRVEGQTLNALLADAGGQFDVENACSIVAAVAGAVAQLHRQNLAHGDLRVDMVLIDDDRQVAVLPRELATDWRLLANSKAWLDGQRDVKMVEIAQYQAPELAAASAQATPTSDVYSLGCMLFALLVGKPPFQGSDVCDVIQQHAAERIPPLPRRGISTKLHRVLIKSLAKNVEERYPHAEEFAQAMQPFATKDYTLQDADENVSRALRDWITQHQSALPAAAPPLATAVLRDSIELPIARPISAPSVAPSTITATAVTMNPSVDNGSATPANFHSDDEALLPTDQVAVPRVAVTSARSNVAPPKSSIADRYNVAILAAAVGIIAISAIVLLTRNRSSDKHAARTAVNDVSNDRSQRADSTNPPRTSVQLVADDANTLWVSPTHGRPIATSYLPTGTQLVLSLRVAELLAHPQAEQIIAALGPNGQRAMEHVERATRLKVHEIAELTIGVRADGSNRGYSTVFVARPIDSVARDDLRQRVSARAGLGVMSNEADSVLLPTDTEETVLVTGTAQVLAEIDNQGEQPVPLQRELEQLLTTTDRQRHATVLVAPQFLRGDGRQVLGNSATPISTALAQLLDEQIAATAISLHWDADFFLEWESIGSIDLPPWEVQDRMKQRIERLPDEVADWVFQLQPRPYGRRILARLPEMLRRLATYTRWASTEDRVIMRCYLPQTAGHNLLAAVELALAEDAAHGIGDASPNSESPPAQSIDDRLDQVISLSFDRESLTTALTQLADDIGISIVLDNAALEAAGITRNQNFAIDLQQRTARDVLAEILRRADSEKKLVYLIAPAASGKQEIRITTRQDAAASGVELPEVLRLQQ